MAMLGGECSACCGGGGGGCSDACWIDCDDFKDHADDFTASANAFRSTAVADAGRGSFKQINTSTDPLTSGPDADRRLIWNKGDWLIYVDPHRGTGQAFTVNIQGPIELDLAINCESGEYVVTLYGIANSFGGVYRRPESLIFTDCVGEQTVWDNTNDQDQFGQQWRVLADSGPHNSMLGRFEVWTADNYVARVELINTNPLMRQFDADCLNNPLP